MKRLLTLFLVLWCSTAWAVEPINLASTNPYVAGARVAAAACDPGTNEIGERTQGSTSISTGADVAKAIRYTADCSGTLDTAYIYSYEPTAGAYWKICIYSDDGSGAPEDTNLLIGCSPGTEETATAGWKSGVMDGGTVTQGSSYWLVISAKIGNADTLDGKSTSTDTTLYYKAASGHYASPPANMGTGWNSAADKTISSYVTIK